MSLIKEFHKRVGHLVKDNVWDTEYSSIIINEKIKKELRNNSLRTRGAVRITQGLISTKEGRNAKMKMMLKQSYP